MPVNLTKGQKVDLTKGNSNLNDLLIGLGWDVNKYDGGEQFDLDTSCFLLDANEKVRSTKDFVFYGNLKTDDNSVIHRGDNLTGEGDGDDEQIEIKLKNIPDEIKKIVFVVTIYDAIKRKQNFGQISNAYIKIINSSTNEELVRYDLSEDYSIETGLIVGELYRHNGEWKFGAVGEGYEGGLEALCAKYGC